MSHFYRLIKSFSCQHSEQAHASPSGAADASQLSMSRAPSAGVCRHIRSDECVGHEGRPDRVRRQLLPV